MSVCEVVVADGVVSNSNMFEQKSNNNTTHTKAQKEMDGGRRTGIKKGPLVNAATVECAVKYKVLVLSLSIDLKGGCIKCFLADP